MVSNTRGMPGGMNTFTSKVSRSLDKPNPKLLGQDKPQLELAVGWIRSVNLDFVWGGGGGEILTDMKKVGMLVVSLRGVNFWFWFRLGCSG